MKTRRLGVVAIAAIVASCGGGDGSSGGIVGGGTPITPTLAVTLSSPSTNLVVDEGGTASFGFEANYSGSSSLPIVAVASVSGDRVTLDGGPVGTGNKFTVNLKTAPFGLGGLSSSIVTFKLCTNADCSVIYPGSTQQFAVGLDVRVKDWANFQRNNAHTGYVAVRFDPTKFVKAWEYTDEFPAGRIRPPAASRGLVLATIGRDGGIAYAGTMRVKALDAATGAVRWTYDLGEQAHASGPSLANGMVHVTSMVSSSNANPQWVLDLATGGFRNQMAFASQWSEFNQPAAEGSNAYVAAGFYGSVLYAYDTVAGTKVWETTRTGGSIWDGQSLALDATYLYYYSGSALDQVNRSTGNIVRSIAIPDYETETRDYEAAPVLDGNANVFLFSGDKRNDGRNKIIGLSLNSGSAIWQTAAGYTTAFALKDGIIYGARQDAHVISAIDAANGAVLWSTALPGSDPIVGNVIATENLLFVSSGTQTWAIDLKQSSHPVVWTAPTGGRLAITPDNYLLTTGMRDASRLTAYRLF